MAWQNATKIMTRLPPSIMIGCIFYHMASALDLRVRSPMLGMNISWCQMHAPKYLSIFEHWTNSLFKYCLQKIWVPQKHYLCLQCRILPWASQNDQKSLAWEKVSDRSTSAAEAYTQKSIFPVKGVMFLCASWPKQEVEWLSVFWCWLSVGFWQRDNLAFFAAKCGTAFGAVHFLCFDLMWTCSTFPCLKQSSREP